MDIPKGDMRPGVCSWCPSSEGTKPLNCDDRLFWECYSVDSEFIIKLFSYAPPPGMCVDKFTVFAKSFRTFKQTIYERKFSVLQF